MLDKEDFYLSSKARLLKNQKKLPQCKNQNKLQEKTEVALLTTMVKQKLEKKR